MKNVIILLVIFFAVRTLRRHLAAKHKKEVEEGEKAAGRRPADDGEEMVHDPVCDSYITISSAFSVKNGREKIFFCSDDCRGKYLASIKNT